MLNGDQYIANVAGIGKTVHVSPYTRAAAFNTVAINLQKELHRRRYVRNANTKYNVLTNALNATGVPSAPAATASPSTAQIYNIANILVNVDRVGFPGQERTVIPKISLAYAMSDALKFCVDISSDLELDVQSKGGVAHDAGTNPNFRYFGRIPINFLSEFTNKTNDLASRRMSGIPGANANGSLVGHIKTPDAGPRGAEQHGCRNVCTGMCTGSCINLCNGCTGCTGACGYGCGYGCNTSCTGAHAKMTGDCSGCDSFCHGTASGGCGNSCSVTCGNDCTNICRGGCGNNCTGTCADNAGAVTGKGYAIGGAQAW